MLTLLWIPAALCWRCFFGSAPDSMSVSVDGEWSWSDLSQAEECARRVGLKTRRTGKGIAVLVSR